MMILPNMDTSPPSPAFDSLLYNPKNIQVAEFAYPDIATLNCDNVQQEIDRANGNGKQLDSWFVEANKIKDACAAKATGGTLKLSKNLSPYVLLLGIAVGAIILTKILKNTKK